MSILLLLAAMALPWLLGAALVAGLPRRNGTLAAPGEVAWVVGTGAFAGLFVLTLWMRVLAVVGVPFSLASVGAPLLIALVAVTVWLVRGRRGEPGPALASALRALAGEGLTGWRRVLWFALLAWLALRFVLLGAEVVWRPVYPWDAWIQWATKSRVWYELRTIVPFERAPGWWAADGAAWFDASPDYPATVPLLPVWASLALGRWDDALMNLPWWMMGAALAIAIYGALRREGFGALAALAGTWLANSLPLLNVHVALAGYADLPLAAFYALGALAALRWARAREPADLILALVLIAALPTIKKPGLVWALTLIPGLVVALWPRRGPRWVVAGLAAAILALLVLAQTHPVILGYRLHLDFAPAWWALIESYFLLGNWHLLWYAAPIAALFAGRRLLAPGLAPYTFVIATGLLFLFVVFGFTNARAWVTDQTTVNRATLHLVPLLAVWTLVVFRDLARRRSPVAPEPSPPAAAA